MKPRYIAHTGGPMPVDPNLMLEVVFRERTIDFGLSDRYYWCHDKDGSDIIAYRVIEQE